MSENIQGSTGSKNSILESRKVMYIFMISLLIYTLLCGYILIFSGSLFFEALIKGWWSKGASDYDNQSFFLGYLYGFPSLLGVLGGVAVLSTGGKRFYKFKILFFIPSAVWATQLVIGNFRWGLTYWTQWLYLVPIMCLSFFVLYCVVKKVSIPILKIKPRSNVPEESSQVEVS